MHKIFFFWTFDFFGSNISMNISLDTMSYQDRELMFLVYEQSWNSFIQK